MTLPDVGEPVAYRAEYIWIDGWEPTPLLRSKTKVIDDGSEPGIWGFDGSSTNQAPGKASDCVLQPVFVCPDPIRGGDDVLVMCEVLLTDMTPHPTNTRAACAAAAETFADQEPIFGIEQEYTFLKDGYPLGWPKGGYPGPQGPYYCGVGSDEIWGREIVEAHTTACMDAGLHISGTNAEVMMGQWEFQIGPIAPPLIGDEMYIARWLLYRIAEDFDVAVTIDPKPIPGDWNGAGAHTNFSTKAMRGRTPPSTSPTTAPASSVGSPGCTRRRRGPSSATACRTVVPRCASRGRSRSTRRATSRIVAPTRTAIPTR